MPNYRYVALTPEGTTMRGVQPGRSAVDAGIALRSRDLTVMELVEKKSILQFELTRKKVPRKELMHFSRQMAAFLRAGIPVLEAMEVIREETSNNLFGRALTEMADSLERGETFAGAAAAHPAAFPPFYIGILRSAEMTGNLDTVLEQLSEYIERDLEARQKIVSALVYPAVVLAMSVVTVLILTIFVLPRFEKFFKSLHAKLPLATRMLLTLSHFMITWYPLIGVAAFALVVAFSVSLRSRRGRDWWDALLLRVPVVGDLAREAILERFCRILASMTRAGVPLPEALTVTGGALNNAVYRDGLIHVREAMLRGEGLADPLAATKLFPAAARQMLRVGEDTGTLDRQLETTSVYFNRELDYKIKRFTSLFEPVVIVLMGVIVGFVAIALVSAMYGIYHQVNVPK